MTLIALAGLLGSGKSSVVRKISESDSTLSCFLEPEEPDYPAFVAEGDGDNFGVHSWFRAQRASNLHRAKKVSDGGGIALVDSYYDRMLASYVRRPEFDWLLGGSDDYLDALEVLSFADRSRLPRADQIIFLHVSPDAWIERLDQRRRSQDDAIGLRDRHVMQNAMMKACEEIASIDDAILTLVPTDGRSVEEVSRMVSNQIHSPLSVEIK